MGENGQMKSIYIIIGEYGERDTLETWIVCAFLDKKDAQQYMEKAALHVKQIQSELKRKKNYFDRNLGERISRFDSNLKDARDEMWIGIDKEVTYRIEENSLLEYK